MNDDNLPVLVAIVGCVGAVVFMILATPIYIYSSTSKKIDELINGKRL